MSNSYGLKVLGLIILILAIAGGYLYLQNNDVFNQPIVEPQSQLGAAAGTIEAILGNNQVGTGTDEANRNAISAYSFTASEAGTIESMSVYIANAEAGSQYSLAIYADDAGNPGALITNTSNQTVNSTGWHTAPLSGSLTAGTTYWLAYNTTASVSSKNVLSYTTGTGVYKWHLQTFGTWPANFGTVNGTANDVIPSLYVTYSKPAPVDSGSTNTGGTDFVVGATITVSQGPINIRSNTSLNSSIVGTANAGDLGTVLQGPTQSGGYSWWKVSYATAAGTVTGWTTGAYQYVVTGGGTTTTPTPFEFSLSAGSLSQSVEAGKSTSNNLITVTKVSGTPESVSLSASVLPTGASAAFTPTSCTPDTNNCTANLVVNTTSSAAAGSYTVTVKGTSATTNKTTTFTLNITAPVVVTPTPTDGKYQIGDRIWVTSGPLNIRSDVKINNNTVLGTQPTGAVGTVVDGPKKGTGNPANRYTWYKVDYDSGVDGWNTENYTDLFSTGGTQIFDFSLTADAASKAIIKGQSAASIITATIVGTAPSQNVSFSVSGLPTGVTGAFTPTSCSPTCPSTLLLTASTNVNVGNYPITVTATGGGKTKTTNFTLNVSSGTTLPTLDFNLTIPAAASLDQGDTTSVNGSVVITSSNSAQTIALSAAGLPTGVTAIFNPTTCTSLSTGGSTCNFALGLAALGSVPAGTYNLTINAVGGGVTKTTPLTLTVNSVNTTPNSTTFKAGDKVEIFGAGNLNIRSTPGGSILGTLPDNTTGFVQADANNGVYTSDNFWWKTDFGSLVGWAAEAFLRLFQNTPPPPPPPPVNDGSGVGVGVNLGFPWDVNREKIFADLVYSGRPFETNNLDANGWPQADFKFLVMTEAADVPLGADRLDNTGVFTLAFNGQADVGVINGSMSCPTGKTCSSSYNGGRMYYNSALNQSVAEVTFATSQDYTWSFGFNFSNTKRTPSSPVKSGVTEVRVIRPGHAVVASNGEYKAKQKFSQEFLNDTASFQVFRLMDYMYTNLVWAEGNTDQRIATLGPDGLMGWSERPTENKQRSIDTAFGGPIEHMVDLANVTGKDLWINIPTRAIDDNSSDSYVRNLALYLKNNLNSNSKVYIEWSNEVWNGQFRQHNDAEAAGSALGLRSRYYTIKKIIDISNVFRSVFGDAAMMTRIRPVYADQFASSGEVAATLAWAYGNYPNLLNYYLYGLAIAPYYGGGGYSDSGTPSQLLSGVLDSINGRLSAIMDAGNRGGTYVDFYSMARSYGLKYFTYEGGTDFGYSSVNGTNKISLQYNPGMKDRTLGYLGQWDACGGDLFMYFDFGWPTTGKFQWGLTDNPGSPFRAQPKLQGAQQAATIDRRYFECAPLTSSFFSYNPYGSIGTGVGLTGTYYSDNNFGTVAKYKNGQSIVRIDPIINFIWNNYGVSDPYPRLDYTGGVHSFSTKWTGQIQPKFTGTYRFEMELDSGDSATVKINGQSVLGTTVNLTAGTKYSIEVTYQPNGAGGIARLWWSSTGGSNGNQIRAIVPKSQLYPN